MESSLHPTGPCDFKDALQIANGQSFVLALLQQCEGDFFAGLSLCVSGPQILEQGFIVQLFHLSSAFSCGNASTVEVVVCASLSSLSPLFVGGILTKKEGRRNVG